MMKKWIVVVSLFCVHMLYGADFADDQLAQLLSCSPLDEDQVSNLIKRENASLDGALSIISNSSQLKLHASNYLYAAIAADSVDHVCRARGLEGGAEIVYDDGEMESGLFFALRSRSNNVVLYFVKEADVDVTSIWLDETTLSLAIDYCCSFKVIEALLEKGSNAFYFKDERGDIKPFFLGACADDRRIPFIDIPLLFDETPLERILMRLLDMRSEEISQSKELQAKFSYLLGVVKILVSYNASYVYSDICCVSKRVDLLGKSLKEDHFSKEEKPFKQTLYDVLKDPYAWVRWDGLRSAWVTAVQYRE